MSKILIKLPDVNQWFLKEARHILDFTRNLISIGYSKDDNEKQSNNQEEKIVGDVLQDCLTLYLNTNSNYWEIYCGASFHAT